MLEEVFMSKLYYRYFVNEEGIVFAFSLQETKPETDELPFELVDKIRKIYMEEI